jgi:hypothetical protein
MKRANNDEIQNGLLILIIFYSFATHDKTLEVVERRTKILLRMVQSPAQRGHSFLDRMSKGSTLVQVWSLFLFVCLFVCLFVFLGLARCVLHHSHPADALIKFAVEKDKEV